MRNAFLCALLVSCAAAVSASAQNNSELLTRMRAMEDRIQALETEVRTLRAVQAPGGSPAQAETVAPSSAMVPSGSPPSGPLTLGGAGGAAAKVLNPDIAVIGNFVGAAGNSAGSDTPAFEMRE